MLSKKYSKYIRCLALLVLLFNVQCKKEKITDDTYFGGKIMILGHRGMGAYYKIPGDTYESIVPAIGIGSDGCEIDLHLTKDTVLVLFHDHLLKPATTCEGAINEFTWEQLKECKYYGLKNMVFLSSAEEVFSKLPNITSYYFSFDCKLDTEVPNFDLYQGQFLRAIQRLCEKYNMSQNVLLEGGEYFLLNAQALGLSNKMFLSGALNEKNIEIASNNSFFGICSQMDDIEEIGAASAHAKNLRIMAYTPSNYYLNKYAIRKKIDILQTDDPISILKQFERFNYNYVIP